MGWEEDDEEGEEERSPVSHVEILLFQADDRALYKHTCTILTPPPRPPTSVDWRAHRTHPNTPEVIPAGKIWRRASGRGDGYLWLSEDE